MAESSGKSSRKRKEAPESEPQDLEDKDDAIVANVVEAQARVAKKKRVVEVFAKPGTVPAYVHPTGAVIGPLKSEPKVSEPTVTKQSEKTVGKPMSTPDGLIHVRMGAGAVWPAASCSKFRLTSDWACTNVLMVDSVNVHLHSADGLRCRLHGLSICDNAYLASNMRKGSRVSFARALNFHYHLFLSEEFLAACPDHGNVLLEHGHFENCKLRVYRGSMPEKPTHPRLTYEVRPEGPDKLKSMQLNLDSLLTKLGILCNS